MLFDDGWLRTSHGRMNHEGTKNTKVRGFREILQFHPLHPHILDILIQTKFIYFLTQRRKKDIL
ncbi:hypothetical protein [Anabaena sp. UHCC 0204]|uniref:hypothetical protein n=1 Tax=Anabaena sp. UHCC 0204 TaxID=2590009 RepID=UPI0014462DD1|nr:hypothetical protein [Anabaena sp. UHCC 0204]MTJ10277.1 hypothetical protein [Anabaena sp. UHCC 0204]